MDGVRRNLAAKRASTDASLNVERATTDATAAPAPGRQKHRIDSRIDRDRFLADARLVKFREDTNDNLVTERARADVVVDALVETKDALAQAQTEQANYADAMAMVAHDLRSPLSVITMNAQSIEASTTEAATREAARDVAAAAARMERLLADYLDVARIESGTLRITKHQYDLHAFLKEVERCYQPLFDERGMSLSVEAPDAKVTGWFDHDRIVQVLSNLLGNAMKVTTRGQTVRLHAEQKGDSTEFVVSDSGPGIAPGNLTHVFERFWQAQHDPSHGVGLGLYICAQIVGAHAGQIWAESVPGNGATFRFTLPSGESDDPVLPGPPSQQPVNWSAGNA